MILTTALLGLSAASFAGFVATHVSERKALKKKRDNEIAAYIKQITDENEQLRNENESLLGSYADSREQLRNNLFRELGWLDERKRLNNRLNIAFRELACDDSKKTQVLRRS